MIRYELVQRWAFPETMNREVVGGKRSLEVRYTIFATLYYMAHIAGRGTMCFAAVDDEERKEYVIKDSWVSVDEL